MPDESRSTSPTHSNQATRAAIRNIEESKIREVANAAMGMEGVLAFWFGEPDQVTPDFVREAAIESLRRGETFYSHNLGLSPLREAIAGYLSKLHSPTLAQNVAVTSSGVNALMLVYQVLFDPGDRVVIVTPVWPNVTEGPKILGADVVRVPLELRGNWHLDIDRLLAALTPATRALILNSPNNPTGWTVEREAQQAILAHCRRLGIWIIADDVYERIYFQGGAAPSFLDIATAEDRVISTNSFSKAWLMTGWRLGWIVAPDAVMAQLSKVIEYNTSCAPVFVQRAALSAISMGEETVVRTQARLLAARNFLIDALKEMPRVEVAQPSGAMYAFLRVHRVNDSVGFAKRLIQSVKLGLAPGAAFGPEGEGCLRWCFASSLERLADGVERFKKGLESAS